jgi:dTMP kinase
MKKTFYGKGIPGTNPTELNGLLIVIEGPDGSGRSTQSALLMDWLGRLGFPTSEFGLRRSSLVGPELGQAMEGNTLHPLTLSLFYATDFADQLENSMVPALRAGFVVVADRYIYTLMARDVVRGAAPDWIREVYGMAIVPDVRIYLDVKPKLLAERSFQKEGVLDYWESGMDIQRSGDIYQCFIRYQNSIRKEFMNLVKEYDFQVIDGERDPLTVHREIQEKMRPLIENRLEQRGKPAGRGCRSRRAKA